MSWNGSGVVVRTDGTRTGANIWAQADAAGVKIRSDHHDTHDEDLASAIEACWNRNGENALTANASAGGFKITNLADGASDGDALSYDQDSPRFASTEDGASAGPTLTLYRNSATPAASDLLGRIEFMGEDDGGATQVYGAIEAQISDATNGSEDGRVKIAVPIAGTEQSIFRVGQGYLAQLQSNDAGASAGPDFILWRNSASPADGDVLGDLQFGGNDDAANFTVYAAIDAVAEDVTDGTEDGYHRFRALRGGAEVISLSPGILRTAQATTSGNSKNFGSIPAGARRITVMYSGVSTSGSTDNIILRLGDAGGVEDADYDSGSGTLDDTAVQDTGGSTTSFLIIPSAVIGGGGQYSGQYILTHMGGNVWVGHGACVRNGTDEVTYQAGVKTLSAELTQVQFMLSGTPTDAFDAGSVNILVE